MIALKEVGNLALAQFWVSEFTCRCGTAQHEVTTLLDAVRCTLISVDQLLDSIVETKHFRVSSLDMGITYVEAVSTPCIFGY